MKRLGLLITIVKAVGPRPALWPTLVRQARRFVAPGWWRRAPFLPVPDAAMLAFRSTTQYGDPSRDIEPDDLVVWLEWCRQERVRLK